MDEEANTLIFNSIQVDAHPITTPVPQLFLN